MSVCVFIYAHMYLPAVAVSLPEFTRTVRASNAGYPFQLYYGPNEALQPKDVKPQELVRYADSYGEYGISLMVATTSVIGRLVWGPDFLVTDSTASAAVAVFLVVTALLLAHPYLPVPVSIVLQGLFVLLMTEGSIQMGSSQLWGTQYAVLLASALAITATLPKRSFSAFSFMVPAVLLLAYSRYLRQESAGIPIALVGSLLAGAGLLILTSAREINAKVISRDFATVVLRRVAITASAILVAGFVLSVAVRGAYSAAWGTPYSQTNEAKHGSGWPLYLGLGYVSNPLNIGWADAIGQMHVQMIAPGVPWATGEAFQNALEAEWRHQLWTSPWLLLGQLQAKAVRLHQTLWEASRAAADQSVEQGSVAAWFYRVTTLGVPLCVLLLLLGRGSPATFLSCAGLLGVAAAACAGPLIVHPGFISGPQAVALTLLPMLTLAFQERVTGGLGERPTSQADLGRWGRKPVLAAIGTGLLLLLLVAGFVAVQQVRFTSERQAVLVADPWAEIQRLGFRYGHFFNSLDPEAQLQIIRRLRTSTGSGIAERVLSTRGSAESFEPLVVVATPKQLHLIVRLSASVRPPSPRIFQGDTHTIVQVCIRCTETTGILIHDYSDRMWALLNDHEWRDAYRFVSFPADLAPAASETAIVGAYRIVGLDARVPNTGWVTELIAEAQMRFHHAAK